MRMRWINKYVHNLHLIKGITITSSKCTPSTSYPDIMTLEIWFEIDTGHSSPRPGITR